MPTKPVVRCTCNLWTCEKCWPRHVVVRDPDEGQR